MREIKFRAWNKKKNKMTKHFGYGKTYMSGGDGISINELIKAEQAYNMIIMQYTGLKDKNEKEIYEGDVVESVSPIIMLSTNKETGEMGRSVYVVGYEKDRARFNFKRITDNNFEGYGMKQTHQSKWYTIIGNVYENPELKEAI